MRGSVSAWIPVLLMMILNSGCYRSADYSLAKSRAAAALFERFETVVHSGSARLNGLEASNEMSPENARDMRRPFEMLERALNWFGGGTYIRAMQSGEAVLVGAKGFRPPTGLGLATSKFCYVVILRNNAELTIRKLLAFEPSGSAAGAPVWNWSAQIGEYGDMDSRPSTLYGSQADDAYLIVSNDFDELRAVASSLAALGAGLAPLTKRREWNDVSKHEYWAYRHYPRDFADFLARPGRSVVESGTEALILFGDWKQQAFTLRVILSSTEGEATVARINKAALLPPMKTVRPGVWETTIPFTPGQGMPREVLFGVMWLLGFAVFV